MEIYYGKDDIFVNVTNRVRTDVLYFSDSDVDRYKMFGIDPIPNVVKSVKIVSGENSVIIPAGKTFKVYLENGNVICENIEEKLNVIHSRFILRHGHKTEEYPEQIMAAMFIDPKDRVLEIGSNIGRNSLVISHLLESDENFVTLESDEISAAKLIENRDLNGRHFKVEVSALSSRRLIQKGWNTYELDEGKEIPSDYKEVKTITLEQLNFNFNVLVLDCEGAIFNILVDMEHILDNVDKIIIENDFTDIKNKIFVDGIFAKRGFRVAYSKSGGWGPCYSMFFETWVKY